MSFHYNYIFKKIIMPVLPIVTCCQDQIEFGNYKEKDIFEAFCVFFFFLIELYVVQVSTRPLFSVVF